MSVAERYDANYQRIATDHVAHWRETGRNPFQTPQDLAIHENLTVDAIQRYAPPNARILDAGCGMGDLLLRLGDFKAEGCDIADPYLDVARERGLVVRKAAIEKLPYRTSRFGVVVAADILEHVLDLNAAVEELLRVLKPDGFLIVRGPDSEEMSQYSPDGLAYEFIHLRRLDEHSLRILLVKVFEMEVLEVSRAGLVVQVVAIK